MKRAYQIKDICHPNGVHGRTRIFQAIKEGRLVARKDGRKTIILAEDYERFLQSLPTVAAAEKRGRDA